MGYAVTGAYSRGAQVEVLGKNEEARWLQVETADGKTGWMSASLLDLPVPLAEIPVVGLFSFDIEGITFVYVPAGEFLMGSTESQVEAALALCRQYQADCDIEEYLDELPQHRVYLDPFWIMRTEVTNAEFARFNEAGGYTKEEYWTSDGWAWRNAHNITGAPHWGSANLNSPQQPVVGVTWYEAAAYAKWLGATSGYSIRLPTEAEWEKAARGTDGRIFPWGHAWNASRANFCDSNCPDGGQADSGSDGYAVTAPVESYSAGASPYGLLNMAGNAFEWTNDWYSAGYYANSPARNPTGPDDGDERVLRGGAWNFPPTETRTSFRSYEPPDLQASDVGFRLVVEEE